MLLKMFVRCDILHGLRTMLVEKKHHIEFGKSNVCFLRSDTEQKLWCISHLRQGVAFCFGEISLGNDLINFTVNGSYLEIRAIQTFQGRIYLVRVCEQQAQELQNQFLKTFWYSYLASVSADSKYSQHVFCHFSKRDRKVNQHRLA